MSKKVCAWLVLGAFLLCFTTGCDVASIIPKSFLIKEAISGEDFKAKMESAGYEIDDRIEYYDDASYLKKVYFAVNNEKEYKIEFYQFMDKNNAINFYNSSESKIEMYKSSGYSETNINILNQKSYSLSSDGSYYVVSRIDNTVIYSRVDSEYSKEVKDIITEFGYVVNFSSLFSDFISLMIILVISLIVTIFFIVCLWRLFVKAGRPGWGSLIPFYNYYLLADITFGNGWKILLSLIPFVNVIFWLYFFFKLAKVYGKSILFGLGLLFLWPIFLPILAFGKAQYKGYE